MPRYTAQVWLPNEIPYEVETNAPSIFAAKEIIARREGVDEKYVGRLFTINENDSSSSSSSSSFSGSGIDISDIGGIAALCAILFVIWLFMEYWMFMIPGSLIIGILLYFGLKDD